LIQLELPLEAPARPVRRRKPPSARSPLALARLARHLGRKIGARRRVRDLVVIWNRRLRTALGRADFSARTIELNPTLLDRHPAELLPTLVHELCHLIAGARAAHGARWREAMLALGARPEACHRLDVSDLTARRRVWIWTCTRCGESYSRRSRGVRRFRCGRCRGPLRVSESAESR
jgi:predicted SprT family Zn-dependent metalloprotease